MLFISYYIGKKIENFYVYTYYTRVILENGEKRMKKVAFYTLRLEIYSINMKKQYGKKWKSKNR